MNTEYKSLYDILGVAANATPDEIHSAYKRLAKKYHPDINAGLEAGEMMRLLNGAHEILSNTERRAQYDEQVRRSVRAYACRVESFDDPNRHYLLIIAPQKYHEAVRPLVTLCSGWEDWNVYVWNPEEYCRHEVSPSERVFVLFVGDVDENPYVGIYGARLNFQIKKRAGVVFAWDDRRGIICGDGNISHKKDLQNFAEAIKADSENIGEDIKKSDFIDMVLFGMTAFSIPTAIFACVFSAISLFYRKANIEKMRQLQVATGILKFTFDFAKMKTKRKDN